MRLEGKVAVISGGARGMGAVEARLFAKEGARVVCADLRSYAAFLRDNLTQLEGVRSIESSFALGQVKYSRVLPL